MGNKIGKLYTEKIKKWLVLIIAALIAFGVMAVLGYIFRILAEGV